MIKTIQACILLLLIHCGLVTHCSAQTIATTAPTSACLNSNIQVHYTITGTFSAGQTLNAELSDVLGTFLVPVVIGSKTGITTGTDSISAVIPLLTLPGNSYRIRIVAAPANVVSDTVSGFTVLPGISTPVFNTTLVSTRCQASETIVYGATLPGFIYSLDATSLAGGNTIDSTNGAVTFSGTWVGASTITATANGCGGPLAATFNVTTNGAVTVPAFVAGLDTVLCQGAQTVVYGATATNNSSPLSYSISNPAAGTFDTTTGSLTYGAGFTGNVTITAHAQGCPATATNTFSINVKPALGTTTFNTGLLTNRCQGAGTATYTATAANATSLIYSLSPATAGTIDSISGLLTFDPAFTGTATITATAAGCGTSAPATINVMVDAPVSVPVFTSTLPATRCQSGGSDTLVATASSSTAISYSVSPSGAGTIDTVTGIFTRNAAFSGNIVFTAKAAGCGGPQTATFSQTITPSVTQPLFSAGPLHTRCPLNDTTTYTATASNTTGITYSLDAASLSGGNTILATTGRVIYAAGWSGVTRIYASAAGCNGPLLDSFLVTTNPAPAITSANTRTICSGIVDTEIMSNTGAGTEYKWTTSSVGAFIAGAVPNAVFGPFSVSLTNISPILTDSVLYTITPRSAAGCIGAPSVIKFRVSPGNTILNTITNKTICSGTSTDISLVASALNSFTWTVDNPGGISGNSNGSSLTGINQVLTNSSDVSPEVVNYIVTPVAGSGCLGAPKTFSITVNPSPSVTTAATASVCSDLVSNVALTSSTGGNSSFIWAVPTRTSDITGGSADSVGGSTARIAQVLHNANNANAGTATYAVRARSAAGCSGATKNIDLTINPIPVSSSPTTASVCSGVMTKIALTASTGAGTGFTWAPATVSPNITGAGSGSDTLKQTLINSSNTTAFVANYTILPKSAQGCSGAVVPIAITVNPAPLFNTSAPAPICSGTATNIVLSTTTTGTSTFTWSSATDTNIVKGTVPGTLTAPTIAQTLTNTSNTSPALVNYTILPKSALGCSGNPAVVTVTVNPLPTVVTPATATICNDARTNISLLSSTGAGSSFTRSLGPIVGSIAGTTIGAGASITDSLHNNSNTAAASVKYIVTPTSGLGCTGPKDTITVTINPAPTVSTASTFSICSGQITNIPLTTFLSGASTFSYATPVSVNVTGGNSGIGDIVQQLTNITDLATGTVVYTVRPTSELGCIGVPKAITVTVNPAPSLTTNSFFTICSEDTVRIPLTTSTTGASTYSWTVFNVTGGTTGASSGAADTIKQSLKNPNDIIPTTVVYRITPRSVLTCLGAPTNVTVNVNPSPTLNAVTSAIICSGTATNIGLGTSTGNTGSKYKWSVVPVTGTVNGASADSLGTTIAQTLVNISSTDTASIKYVVVPTSAVGCTGLSKQIPVIVNPKPVGTTVTPLVICSSTSANDTLKASVPSTFVWSAPTSITGNITGGTAGAGPVISQVLFNPDSTTGSAGSVTYNVTPTSNLGGCVGNPQSVTVVVNALPRITSPVSNTFTICDSSTTSINIASNIISSVFNYTTSPSTLGFITGNVNGSGNTINQVLANSSNALRDSVLYTITPINTSSLVTCTGIPKTVAVIVNPEPVLTPVTDSICSGTRPNIVLVSSTGSGSTFGWTIGTVTGSTITGQSNASGPVINQQLTNTTFTAAGTVPYIVTPTSVSSCIGKPAIVSVKVNPLPKLLSDTTRTLCSGETLTYLPVSSTGTTSRYTYSRFADVGTIPNLLSSTSTSVQTPINDRLFANFELTPKTTEYYFRLNSASGCALDSQKLRVTVNPVPDSAGIGVFPTHQLCAGVIAMNFSTRREAKPTEVFVWSSDNGIINQLADSFRRQHSLISFPITSNNNNVLVTSHVAGFSCTSLPSSRRFVVGQGSTSVNPNVVMFNNNLVCQASGVMKYQWGYDTKLDLDSAMIPGATAQNFEIPASGLDLANNFYWVLAEFTDGCIRKAYFNAPSLAINNVGTKAAFSLKLYPNPATNVVNVEFSDANAQNITIELYDLSGKKLRQLVQVGARNQIQVDDLTPGYYMVNCLQDGVRVATSRFIKQ